MRIRSYGSTDFGSERDLHQDAFYIDENHHLYAIADGLDGLPGGQRASQRAVDLIGQSMRQIDHNSPVNLTHLMAGIHEILLREGKKQYPKTGYGTALTLMQILEDHATMGHVGDNVVYLYRDNELVRLTINHTVDKDSEDATEHVWLKDADSSNDDTVLTQCIGQGTALHIEQTDFRLYTGDAVVLCTDGLDKVLTHETIESVLRSGDAPDTICKTLCELAAANLTEESITVITVDIQ